MGLETDAILNVYCDHEGCGDWESDIGGWEEEPVLPDGWASVYENEAVDTPVTGHVFVDGEQKATLETASRRIRQVERFYCPEHAGLHPEEN